MKFLIIWGIGVFIAIITYIIKEFKLKASKILLNILTMISLFTVACIPIGWMGGMICSEDRPGAPIMATIEMILVIILVNLILYAINRFSVKNLPFWIILNVVLIIGSTVWFFPAYKYYNNIEKTTETVELYKQKRELVYFDNIPIQDTSGNIQGSFVLGTGTLSGEIATNNEISYWYGDDINGAIHDVAPTEKSKLVFIEDIESPYLEIIMYVTQIITTNHNNGKISKEIISQNPTYTFYLPSSLKQFGFN